MMPDRRADAPLNVHPTFCLVVAAIACMFFPFGTVLGVLTIIVLQRPSVKEMFRQETSQQ